MAPGVDDAFALIVAAPLYGSQNVFFEEPGLIMTAVEIVGTGKKYSRDELRKLIAGHLCRCTGYENILNAIEKVAGINS